MARMTPLGAIVRGAIAGAIGTAAMDVALYARARATGSTDKPLTWEFGGPSRWDAVAAPAQVGRRLYEGFTQRQLDERYARLTNNVVHWAYGIGWGAAFGVLAGSADSRHVATGPAFGASVWASSYVTMPIAGLYKPIWRYTPRELAPDLAAHLVFGTATERAFRVAGGKETG